MSSETAGSPIAPAPRRRHRRWWIAAGLALLVAADLARPPADQASAEALVGSIHLYQATLSPLMPRLGVGCRFTPTCSRYAEGAIRRYGALGGTARAVWRIARCGPWTPEGTHDPP